MVKIITALENENINGKLNKIEDIKIITKDIQYREGILEILDNYNDVDYILLNKDLTGEISLDTLTEKIKEINKNIKIILIINKKEEKNKFISNNNYYKVLFENEIIENKIYDIFNVEKNYITEKENTNIVNKNSEIKKEIKKLKKIMIKNKLKNSKIKKDKIINKIKEVEKLNLIKIKSLILKINSNKENNIEKNNSLKKCFVIYTIGPNGVGKSSIIINLSKTLSYLNKKVLIIDFDFINNSIHTILGVKNTQSKNYINKINNNIDIFSLKFIYGKKDTIRELANKINLFIIKQRKKYDYIFIDTNTYDSFFEEKIKIYYEIINNSDLILFISGCNLLEINKSSKLLEIYLNKLKINNLKLNILFNKYNEFCIDSKLLKQIFSEIKILGFIKNDEKYNSIINTNVNNFNIYKKIIKNYIEIINLIEDIGGNNSYGDR